MLNEKNKDFRHKLEDELRSEEETARAVRCKGAVFTAAATLGWRVRY